MYIDVYTDMAREKEKEKEMKLTHETLDLILRHVVLTRVELLVRSFGSLKSFNRRRPLSLCQSTTAI
jgi:hypothetical protein